MVTNTSFNLVEATIADIQHALQIQALTSVQLVALYLHRIGKYDCQGLTLNSICVLNPNVFEEAQASDDYRASGKTPRPLEGIPFTIKDSFMAKGMTVAAGSPAFARLVASQDAAIVTLLRNAGAVLLGKTNMPAMADGGGQRGLYGRAESPYNLDYSTTAYASGSSNGCGTSTAANFAAFGFAGETVSSGRAPASNNALVGYSPSRAVIPNRGQWPLYPTCDVIVPHTRSMEDLYAVLNVIVQDDTDAERGIDFWRNQQFVHIPKSSEVRPSDYMTLKDPHSLAGKRVAVPKCFITDQGGYVCSKSVRQLFNNARKVFEDLGAELVETDFPLLDQYTRQDFPGQSCNVPGMSNQWVHTERCEMIASAWDDFLRAFQNPQYPGLGEIDPVQLHPLIAPMDDPSQHTEKQNQVLYSDMIDWAKRRDHDLFNFPECEASLQALEAMRICYFEDWMDANHFDLVLFPTNGDVPKADADEKLESMLHALQPGIEYSNGGRALKHVGIPCLTLPTGMMEDKGMPVGITLATRGFDDSNLLRYAFAFEVASRMRISPPLTPALPTDRIPLVPRQINSNFSLKPDFKISSTIWNISNDTRRTICDFSLAGSVTCPYTSITAKSVEIFANGEFLASCPINNTACSFKGSVSKEKKADRFPTLAAVPKDGFLVVLIATMQNSRSAGILLSFQ